MEGFVVIHWKGFLPRTDVKFPFFDDSGVKEKVWLDKNDFLIRYLINGNYKVQGQATDKESKMYWSYIKAKKLMNR